MEGYDTILCLLSIQSDACVDQRVYVHTYAEYVIP